jgi:hypothetical protein
MTHPDAGSSCRDRRRAGQVVGDLSNADISPPPPGRKDASEPVFANLLYFSTHGKKPKLPPYASFCPGACPPTRIPRLAPRGERRSAPARPTLPEVRRGPESSRPAKRLLRERELDVEELTRFLSQRGANRWNLFAHGRPADTISMASVDLSHPVTHITQQDENYCWACALAMITGRHSFRAALEVAEWCRNVPHDSATGAILPVGVPVAARLLNLTSVSCPPFDAAALAGRLGHGAVAIFGRYNTAGRPLNHVMVVSMMRGDDSTPGSLQIGVDDPWAAGNRWTGTFAAFAGPVLQRADLMVSR